MWFYLWLKVNLDCIFMFPLCTYIEILLEKKVNWKSFNFCWNAPQSSQVFLTCHPGRKRGMSTPVRWSSWDPAARRGLIWWSSIQNPRGQWQLRKPTHTSAEQQNRTQLFLSRTSTCLAAWVRAYYCDCMNRCWLFHLSCTCWRYRGSC